MDNLQINIYPFDKKYNRKEFDCGSQRLNNYLQEQVSSNIRQNVAKCYVIIDNNQNIIAYYTLSAFSLNLSSIAASLTKKLPKYNYIPAALLGRLAVDNKYKGKKLGNLLFNAFARCINNDMGIYALIVDTIDENAKKFYLHYGFIEFLDNSKSLFISLDNIKKLF